MEITRRKVLAMLPAAAVAIGTGELCSGEGAPSADAPGRALYAGQGWTISAGDTGHTLAVSQADLGPVLSRVQLNVRKDGQLIQAGNWKTSVRKDGLEIVSHSPVPVTWHIQVNKNGISVASSSDEAVVTGSVSAPQSRIVARTADPAKVQTVLSPKDDDYTGTAFNERFFVPATAPHVMYTSLGLVDGEHLRSLFDRPSNIAVNFAADSKLRRNPAKPVDMELTGPIRGNTRLVDLTFDYYTSVLGNPRYVPFDDTYHKTAPTGWNSWLAFFEDSTEQDIVEAADWVAVNLKPYGMQHLQQDDGYSRPEARHWVKDWDEKKYPHGPAWLAAYIKSKGLIPGFWSQPYSLCITGANPAWFLRDDQGKIAMDYLGGGELDFTRPDVIQDYWIPILKEMKSQGWGYLKFDMGSTVSCWKNYRNQFYDKTQTPYDISHKTLTIFREVMGKEIWFTDHPDESGARIGLVDVVGCGQDPGPGWKQLNHFLRVISNNTYQNHIIWYSDPDCIVLRGKATRSDAAHDNTEFATFEEARTAASLLSLTGLQFLSGDDLLTLEPDRVDLIKRTIPILPIFPVDLFGRSRDYSRYPVIVDLKVNMPSGVYDVISVTNWDDVAGERVITFDEDLSLNADKTYVVFDFWDQKLLGTFDKKISVNVPSHGTRVLSVHPLNGAPILLGTNRHITGAYGIEKKEWSADRNALSGVSQTVPNAEYSLFFYVPGHLQIKQVLVDGKANTFLKENNGLLNVSFLGRENPAEWSIMFT